jgi:PAS domain S-box-containing protein
MRALIDASPLGIAITDLGGHPIFYNPTCEAMHGMTLEQAAGRGWAEAVHPDDREHVAASWYKAARTGCTWSETYRFRHGDGKVVWVSCRAAPINVEGQHVGYIGTFADITALKSAEEALRASEAKLRRIVESGMVGVFYWNRVGDITEANDYFLSMLGYSRADVTEGRLNTYRLTPPRWRELDEEKLENVRKTGLASQWEKEFCAADGRAVCVLVAKAMLAGVPDSGIAVCVDMTDRKQAESEREQLLRREQQARMQAESAAHMRDQMMAVVAHDLRNPLQAIAMGVASMQQLPMTDSERTRQLGIVQRTAANMSRLIDDLLDVTRLEADQFDIERAPLHIASLFAEISELFETAAREQGVVLSCAGAPDMPPVLADHRRLVQVLSNLVGNALRFTPRGGWISVEARSLEANVTVTVRDNGCGIAVEDLTHLFDRFWRGREKQSGAGLGLFIAKGIVEAHGGRIWAESEPGRGTAMHFTLPAAAEPIAARDAISR